MSFYTELASTSLRLIKEKGQVLTLQRLTTTHDPVTGVDSDTQVSGGPIDALVLPVSARRAFRPAAKPAL